MSKKKVKEFKTTDVVFDIFMFFQGSLRRCRFFVRKIKDPPKNIFKKEVPSLKKKINSGRHTMIQPCIHPWWRWACCWWRRTPPRCLPVAWWRWRSWRWSCRTRPRSWGRCRWSSGRPRGSSGAGRSAGLTPGCRSSYGTRRAATNTWHHVFKNVGALSVGTGRPVRKAWWPREGV